MILKDIYYKQIGVVHSPFKSSQGTPIQTKSAKGVKGNIIMEKQYVKGLKDLEGFSHIILLCHLHLSQGYSLTVKPFMDNKMRGVFSTRVPRRPNSIGLSIVRLISVSGNILNIEDLDIIDGTPLLDIKPYVPDFDNRDVEKIGWLKDNVCKLDKTKDDGRFIK